MTVEVKHGAAIGARMIEPDACLTMTDVRAGVDALDRELARMIGVRFRFMDAAARIKPERSQVRDEARKAEVISNAIAGAAANGWPTETAGALWEALVEASIDYELTQFDAVRPSDAG